jgi:hypothetical protein
MDVISPVKNSDKRVEICKSSVSILSLPALHVRSSINHVTKAVTQHRDAASTAVSSLLGPASGAAAPMGEEYPSHPNDQDDSESENVSACEIESGDVHVGMIVNERGRNHMSGTEHWQAKSYERALTESIRGDERWRVEICYW